MAPANKARFRILRQLGEGAAGVVYEAVDTEHSAADHREHVALRVLCEMDPAVEAFYAREIRLFERLAHPGLAAPRELAEQGGLLLCITELVRGPDLLTYLGLDAAPADAVYVSTDNAPPSFDAQDSPTARLARVRDEAAPVVDPRKLRSALSDVVGSLRLLHENGRVHRAIKPTNVRIRPAPADPGVDLPGRAVLLDVGLIGDEAIAAQIEGTGAGPLRVGQVAYIAPEQARGEPAVYASDLYAVGVLLYRALTGKFPFEGAASAILAAKRKGRTPPDPRELAPECPEDLASLCAELLETDPDDRPSADDTVRRLGAAGMRVPVIGSPPPPRFVGRADELRALEAAYERSRAGAFVGVMVRGGPGMGKTRLLERMFARLRTRGDDPWLLAGRCLQHEAVPFGALDGPMRALARHLAALPHDEAAALLPRGASLLPRMFPALAEAAALARAPAHTSPIRDPDALRYTLLQCLRDLLAILAHRRPVVIAIDDFEHCDPDSANLLDVLLAPPREPALLLVVAQRSDAQPTPGTALTAAAGSAGALATAVPEIAAGFQAIDLLPFSARESRAMVEAMLARTLYDPGVAARRIDDEACGDPGLADEIVRHAALVGAMPSGVDRDALCWTRIQALDPDARRLLEVAAVAGAPVPEQVLAETAGLSAARSARQLAALEWAGLVRYAPSGTTPGELSVEPAHPDVAHAVLDHMPDDLRASIHSELVVALLVAPGGPRHHLRSRHLAALGGDAAAAREAEAAGDEAFDRLALERAAWLYQTAARLCARDPERRGGIFRKLARVLVRTGRRPQAAASFRKASADATDPRVALACQVAAAHEMVVSGHIDRGLEALRELLAERGFDAPDATRTASRVLMWGRSVLGLRRRFKPRADVEPETISQLSLIYEASRSHARVDLARARELCARGVSLAIKSGDPGSAVRFLLLEAELRAGAGELGNAGELLDEAAQIAERTTDPAVAGLMLGARGLLSHAAGRDRAAVAQLAEAEAALAGAPDAQEDTWRVRLVRVDAVRRMGSLADLERLSRRYLREVKQQGDLASEVLLRRRCNLLFLAADDPERARRDLTGTSWTPIQRGYHAQHFCELVARAELSLYEGREVGGARLSENLSALEDSALVRVQSIRVESAWLAGRLAIARAERGMGRGVRDPDIDDGIAAAASRADSLAGESLPQAAVYAALLRGGLAAVKRDRGVAASELEAAIAAADQAGAQLCAAAARRALGAVRGRRGGSSAGAAELRRADDWMANEDIANPAKMTRVIAPGFSRS